MGAQRELARACKGLALQGRKGKEPAGVGVGSTCRERRREGVGLGFTGLGLGLGFVG